jgi:hypothetical protein
VCRAAGARQRNSAGAPARQRRAQRCAATKMKNAKSSEKTGILSMSLKKRVCPRAARVTREQRAKCDCRHEFSWKKNFENSAHRMLAH